MISDNDGRANFSNLDIIYCQRKGNGSFISCSNPHSWRCDIAQGNKIHIGHECIENVYHFLENNIVGTYVFWLPTSNVGSEVKARQYQAHLKLPPTMAENPGYRAKVEAPISTT
ncbi:hypothetical protein JTB14_028003 [Gonioctena quinquepunctata]|nr:hypothetical protein JTB14_028003 [Gonioctena quinquepunctata]